MNITGLVPIVFVDDLDPVLRFYEALGASIHEDDDLGNTYVTVDLEQQRVCFTLAVAEYATTNLVLTYVCNDARGYCALLQSNGFEVVSGQDVDQPFVAEYQLASQVSVAFEQQE